MANEGNRQFWTAHETKMLLQIWGHEDIQSQFDGVVRNDDVYKSIGQELQILGVSRDTKQIREKIKKLKQQYRQAKEKNGKSGAGRSKFQWFEIMDQILGPRPASSGTGLRNSTGPQSQPQEESGEVLDTFLGTVNMSLTKSGVKKCSHPFPLYKARSSPNECNFKVYCHPSETVSVPFCQVIL